MFRQKVFFPQHAFGGVIQISRRFIIPEDPAERSKEKELRQKVVQTYRGMQIPELTNLQYGHFASEVRGTTAAVSQAYGAAKYSSFTASNTSNRKGVDWLMLFTGMALVYYSSKLLLKQLLGAELDAVSLPLWTTSLESQANYLLFTIQFDAKTREEIKNEYILVRQGNPLTNFYQWLRVRYPTFGCGMTHDYNNVLTTLIDALSSNDSRSSMIIARGVHNAVRNQSSSPGQRIDNFLDSLGTLSNSMKIGLSNSQTANNISISPPLDTNSLYGTAQVTLQNALEVSEDEQHSSVPFEQR